MEKKNITFDDIARYTHFSKTTISRYFNNPDSLTLKNQQIIAEALEALNYKENKVARILANGKTEFVGILIPNLFLHYYSEMLNQILSTYETFGYKFLVFVGNEKKDIERQYIQELLAYKIEGMIILSHTISSKELASYNIPLVTIEREDEFVCSVNTDNYMGGVQATSLLLKSGCDILIHMNSDVPEKTPAYGRIKGFLDICQERQVPHELLLVDTGNTYESARKTISQVLEEIIQKYPGRKKGIFMPNDTYANILLNLLIKKYGMLPPDFQIVGFDDSPVSSEAIVPISTVGQQIGTIAREAMELLVMQMDERKKRRPVPLETPIHKTVTPILVRRETTI
ncbi:MAG: substrate-binding domain-containing protein [Eubacteriales bacterium]|nr:substrate-binding domain-containing protein [Eubacteriales bacterium]